VCVYVFCLFTVYSSRPHAVAWANKTDISQVSPSLSSIYLFNSFNHIFCLIFCLFCCIALLHFGFYLTVYPNTLFRHRWWHWLFWLPSYCVSHDVLKFLAFSSVFIISRISFGLFWNNCTTFMINIKFNIVYSHIRRINKSYCFFFCFFSCSNDDIPHVLTTKSTKTTNTSRHGWLVEQKHLREPPTLRHSTPC